MGRQYAIFSNRFEVEDVQRLICGLDELDWQIVSR
jgi:hypothetical protein